MSNLRNFDSNQFIWFIAVGDCLKKINDGGTHSFKGYTNKSDGSYQEYIASKDNKGIPRPKWFTFDESRRRFQVRETDRDLNGVSQYDFLKNSPDCEGSPNGHYVGPDDNRVQIGVSFREFNPAKDAKVSLEADMLRIRAMSDVVQQPKNVLLELGAFIGAFGEADEYMLTKVIAWVEKRPGDYFRLLHSGDRAIRALVKKALADGLFTTKGQIIYWADSVVGHDEDSAVAAIMRDPNMLEALKKKVNLQDKAKEPAVAVKQPAAFVPPKNKGGRPKKVKPVEETKEEPVIEQPQI